jgi:hypothetical protein
MIAAEALTFLPQGAFPQACGERMMLCWRAVLWLFVVRLVPDCLYISPWRSLTDFRHVESAVGWEAGGLQNGSSSLSVEDSIGRKPSLGDSATKIFLSPIASG